MTLVSWRDAKHILHNDLLLLEPPESADPKIQAGKSLELWVYDPQLSVIRRGDNRFHFAGVVRHPGGWFTCAIVEEPNINAPEDGGPRIVGHVIVDVNPRGFIRARTAKGLNGDILELKPSSVSKGELDQSGRKPDATFEANPQRIMGTIAVYRNNVEFPDEEGMRPLDFVAQSTDGRSITALAKLGLLSG